MSDLPVTDEGLQLRPVPTLFKPVPRLIFGEMSAADAGLPVTVRTIQDRWAYAIAFDRDKSHVRDSASSVVAIQVLLSVTSGAVGVGVLNAAKTEYLDEVMTGASDEPFIVELLTRTPSEMSRLMIRNASDAGVSEARILEIRCFEVSAEAVRHPGLSEPRPSHRWNRHYARPDRTLLEKFRLRAFDALTEPVTVEWSDGLSVRVVPGEQLSQAMYLSGTYEPNTLLVLKNLLIPGAVFIDVGANVGIMSLVGSRWVGEGGHVYSFEPSEREYARLVENLDLNHARNVSPARLAVGAQPGHATLRVAAPYHAGLNTLGERFPYEGVDTSRMERVEVTTLDDFVARQKPGRVAVIKIDVEGAEAGVLRGAARLLQDSRPALIVEVFSRSLEANGSSLSEVERLLRDARYELFSIDDTTAALEPVAALSDVDEQNIVALPAERSRGIS